MSGRFRLWAGRALLVLFGLTLATVLLEGGLRIAASFVETGRSVAGANAAEQVILCLGDSHTYGIRVGPEEAYPGQLQRILDDRAPGRYRVLNLGLPGTNSSQVRVRLQEKIRRYRPTVVIVCVGINNAWNHADDAVGAPRWVQGLRIHRLYRLLRARFRAPPALPAGTGRPELHREIREGPSPGRLHRDAETGEVLIEHEGDPAASPGEGWIPVVRRRLRRDLDGMAAIAEGHGVRLLLLTYSAFPVPQAPDRFHLMAAVNQEMRGLASARDLPLVDLRPWFLHLLEGGRPRADLFLSEAEDHPNAAGYREIGRLVANAIDPPPARPETAGAGS